MALAIFFRFYNLTEIPPGLYPDVAINGNDALEALKTGEFKVFYPENNGREGLFMNLIVLSFHVLGAGIFAIKIIPAIIGTLTVLGAYLMIRELYNRTINHNAEIIALASSFFLTISFWHVNFSRLGFRAIMVPFILVWSFYFLFKAKRAAQGLYAENPDKEQNGLLKVINAGYWLIAGLIFGFGFHTYIAFRVAPLILGVIFLVEVFNWWKNRKTDNNTKLHAALWIIFFIAIVVSASPMALYFYNNPLDFMGRTGQVSVLASETPVKNLVISFTKSIGMFNVSGDCNWRHNYDCRPALPLPIGILFLVGIFISLKEIFAAIFIRRRAINNLAAESSLLPTIQFWTPAQIALFLFTWFFAMLLPEVLTNEGLPHSLRAIGAIPAVYIFAGLGGWTAYSYAKSLIEKYFSSSPEKILKLEAGLKAFCIAFLIALALSSYKQYFIDWGKNQETRGAFTQNYVDIARYMNKLPDNVKKYVVVNEGGVPVPYPNGIPMSAQTIMFIEASEYRGNQKAYYIIPDELSNFHGLNQKATYSLVFLLMKYDEKILTELKQRAPNGIIKQEENNIWTFQVSAQGARLPVGQGSASGGKN